MQIHVSHMLDISRMLGDGTEVPSIIESSEAPEGAVSKDLLISVVEDDHSVRASIGRLMRSFGYPVEDFPSAVAFIGSPRLDDTRCLIADVHMPLMTGIELHRWLVDAGRAIPTILITAYPDSVARADALNDGVVGYLHKPFNAEDLLRCVRTALERGELRGQS
jgi:FixJ family two-component response regulator